MIVGDREHRFHTWLVIRISVSYFPFEEEVGMSVSEREYRSRDIVLFNH